MLCCFLREVMCYRPTVSGYLHDEVSVKYMIKLIVIIGVCEWWWRMNREFDERLVFATLLDLEIIDVLLELC